MLQSLRDRMSGPIVWFIVGLIVVPFAFFGIDQFVTGGRDPTVAKVGDQKITQSQLRLAFDQQMQQMQALLGEDFRAEQFNNDRFRQSVLQDMIEEARLRQFVREAGYRASDAAVFGYIQQIPLFQENGRFSTERYRSVLANRGYTPERFEAQLRESIVVDQLREGIVSSGFITDPVFQQAYRLAHQRREGVYARFESARYLDRVNVTDEQVRARYEEDKARYLAPERLRVAYVELNLEELPAGTPPAEDVLRAVYEAEKDARFSEPEERRARHILIRFGADKDAAAKRAATLAEQARKGADFAKLAREHSEDTGSRQQGGDLGWIRRGQMLERFEQALFAMDKGQVSDPVETEYGWHVIRLDEVRKPKVQSYDDPKVRAELTRLYQERERQRRFQELAEKLEQLAFESPSTLEPVAQELGLKLQTSDWLSRTGGTGLFADRTLLDAAFSEDVLQNGENSRPVAVGESRLVVLRKHEYEPPRQRPLEEVGGQIRDALRREAAQAQAQADAQKAARAMNEGRSLEAAARELGASVQAPGLVQRDSTALPPPVREQLFRLPRPAGEQPSVGQVTLPSGDVALVALVRVEEPAWPPAAAERVVQERGRLKDALVGAEFAAYRDRIEQEIPSTILNAAPEGEAAGE